MNIPPVVVRFFGHISTAVAQQSWRLFVTSPAEALQAVNANSGGRLTEYLFEHQTDDYHVLVNGEPVGSIEELSVMQYTPLNSIDFVPAIKGAGGKGLGMVIAGVLLLVLSFVIPGAGIAAAGLLKAAVITKTVLFGVGLSLAFSGVAAMLAPSPEVKEREKSDNRPSYIFAGAVNTYQQGNVIPVGYGILRVGSQIVSAGMRAVNVPADNPV